MTYGDIRNKIYLLTKTNVNSLTNANLNLYTQPAEDKIASLIMQADSLWQFDDSNYTDLPIATTTLTSGQQDYSLATSHLTIDRVEIKGTDGVWRRLRQIDQQELKGAFDTALDEHLSSNGTPIEYDISGNSVFLYPTPNFTQAASLKLYFTRETLKFDFTDDKFTDDTGSATSVPGYNTLFHNLIPLWASYEFGVANGLRNANQIFLEIQKREQDLEDFYGNRDRDARRRMTVSTSGSDGNQSGRLGTRGGDSNK